MRIAIIVPPTSYRPAVTQFPFAAACLAGIAQRDSLEHNVYDCRFQSHLAKMLNEVHLVDLFIILTSEYDKLQCYSINLEPVKSIIQRIKRLSDKPVAVAGPHGTIAPDATQQYTGADVILRGWYEPAMCAFLNRLKEPQRSSLGTLSEPSCESVLTGVCPPYYGICTDVTYFSEIPSPDGFIYTEASTVLSAYHCSETCSFCYRHCGMRGYRRSLHQTLHALYNVASRKGKHAYFIDPVFGGDFGIEATCQSLAELKSPIEFSAQLRLLDFSERNLKMMHEVGCKAIFLGLESFLPLYSKGLSTIVDATYIKKTTEISRRYGIEPLFFLIVGFPNETAETLDFTIEYISHSRASFFVGELQPRPGTALWGRHHSGSVIDWARIERSWLEQQHLGMSNIPRESTKWFWDALKENPRCLFRRQS